MYFLVALFLRMAVYSALLTLIKCVGFFHGIWVQTAITTLQHYLKFNFLLMWRQNYSSFNDLLNKIDVAQFFFCHTYPAK